MICPKCKTGMEAIEFEGVEVDRCKSCKGIWCDAGEEGCCSARTRPARLKLVIA